MVLGGKIWGHLGLGIGPGPCTGRAVLTTGPLEVPYRESLTLPLNAFRQICPLQYLGFPRALSEPPLLSEQKWPAWLLRARE